MIPVILSGGSGTRLWPLSRKSCPKQFLALHKENTLFQETLMALKTLEMEKPIIICNQDHRFTVANNAQEIDAQLEHIILEPMGRNTAPAIAMAAFAALEKEADPVLLVLPADHDIQNQEELGKAYEKAEALAQKGYMVTFGIQPQEAHTGYGYIQLGKTLEGGAHQIQKFIEKPNEEKAQMLLDQGDCHWNSGMFCFKASTFLDELKELNAELYHQSLKAFANVKEDYDFLRLDADTFQECESVSIDVAIMEKTDKGCVLPVDVEWTDVGSWDSVWSLFDKDENDNVLRGDVVEHNTKGNYVHSPEKLTAVLGVEDLIIVNLPDVLLVAHKDSAQDIKKIVAQLEADERSEIFAPSRTDRPWGHATTLHNDKERQVKKLSIKQGAGISLQKHTKRAEHWMVLKGNAIVTKGFDSYSLKENDTIGINPNEEHSVRNAGEGFLDMIEVRSGEYLQEDDIVRINE